MSATTEVAFIVHIFHIYLQTYFIKHIKYKKWKNILEANIIFLLVKNDFYKKMPLKIMCRMH